MVYPLDVLVVSTSARHRKTVTVLANVLKWAQDAALKMLYLTNHEGSESRNSTANIKHTQSIIFHHQSSSVVHTHWL